MEKEESNWSKFWSNFDELVTKLSTRMEKHVSFLLPLFVTYIFWIIFVALTYYTSKEIGPNGEIIKPNFFMLLFDSVVPTTMTYVLCEVIHNFISIVKKNLGVFIWTLLTFIADVVYVFIYFIYLLELSVPWIAITIITTFVLLFLTSLSYKELFYSTNRNHGLT